MKPTSFLRHSTALTLVATLTACLSQPAAPVIVGNNTSGTYYTPPAAATPSTATTAPATTATTNPYGATPYTPSASTTPYTPPAATTTTATSATSGYIPSYAPVDLNAAQHTVVRGDTVYNIAHRYRISQDNLRQWNNLTDNTINVGQVLRVKPEGYVASSSSNIVSTPAPSANTATTTATTTTTTTTTTIPAATTTTPAASSGNTRTVAGITWQRPVSGQILGHFGGNQKGIQIGGSAGEPVLAAADGKVVYSGSGLRGYGNLIIVQHNQTYLTAYGHNQQLLVREGQTVRRGQSIATMGNTDAQRVQLHFEIRQNGTPVDPTRYIPN